MLQEMMKYEVLKIEPRIQINVEGAWEVLLSLAGREVINLSNNFKEIPVPILKTIRSEISILFLTVSITSYFDYLKNCKPEAPVIQW